MDPDYSRLYAQVEDEHWWFSARREIVRRVLSNLNLPANTALLDVGCGTGGNLSVLSEFGRLVGVEMDEFAREAARAREVCDVRDGSLPDRLPFEAGTFDLVTALDVIEHVEDDVAALAGIADVLKDAGLVLVTVPAYQALWSRHDEVNHHYRRYTRPRLEESLRRAGFEKLHISYFNTWLFPAIAAVRLASRAFPGTTAGDDLRMPAPAVNRILRAVFASEARVVASKTLPVGVSLLAVARVRG